MSSFLVDPSYSNKLRATQGKPEEADSVLLRAIGIGEKTLGPHHPDLASRLNNRAAFLSRQVRAVINFEHFSCVKFSGCCTHNLAGLVVERAGVSHQKIPVHFS